nr:hypothetical protein [Thioalkalivibrio sp.]
MEFFQSNLHLRAKHDRPEMVQNDASRTNDASEKKATSRRPLFKMLGSETASLPLLRLVMTSADAIPATKALNAAVDLAA